ncbi:hypothetical protein D3C84_803060 [compost metagenome]
MDHFLRVDQVVDGDEVEAHAEFVPEQPFGQGGEQHGEQAGGQQAVQPQPMAAAAPQAGGAEQQVQAQRHAGIGEEAEVVGQAGQEQGGQVAQRQCGLRPVADQQGAAGQGEQAEPAGEEERQITQRGGAQQGHGQESGQFDARSLRPALSPQRESSVKKM